jgi:hypothetical protein
VAAGLSDRPPAEPSDVTTSWQTVLAAQPRVEVDTREHLQVRAEWPQGLRRIGRHGIYFREDDVFPPTNHAGKEKMSSDGIVPIGSGVRGGRGGDLFEEDMKYHPTTNAQNLHRNHFSAR